MEDFKGKNIVITGGSTGIGFATARILVERGARVMLVARNESDLQRACSELGDAAEYVKADVTSDEDMRRLYQRVKERFGGLDGLFINAGIAAWRPLAEIDEEHYRHLFDTNVLGAILSLKYAVPLLGAGASVVFNGSIISLLGCPQTSVYAATKAAILGLARSAATELLPGGVRVNVVSPGPTDTPIQSKAVASEAAQAEMYPYLQTRLRMGRMGRPEETAHAVVFMLSEAASFIVGQHLSVDGGTSAL